MVRQPTETVMDAVPKQFDTVVEMAQERGGPQTASGNIQISR
jgi:hypothetical protein